jgi:hypothetical protein
MSSFLLLANPSKSAAYRVWTPEASIYRMRGPRHLRTCAWEMAVFCWQAIQNNVAINALTFWALAARLPVETGGAAPSE